MDKLKDDDNKTKEVEKLDSKLWPRRSKNNYLDKWKDITDRGKIKDKLLDRAKEKKALDHLKNIKESRDIMDGLKKMKYFNKWLDKCETKAIFAAFKNMKKRNISINLKF